VAESLTVTLRQRDPVPLDLSFTCEPGQVLAIFGPSGSGKTTILRSIAGLHSASEALVRVGPHIWHDTATRTHVPVHRRPVGVVQQEYGLFPHLTAEGNVMTALGHRPRQDRLARAQALLQLVHLRDQAHRRPADLSGGERQRVAVARALARDPAVLLLDEPFAAVDRPVRRCLQDEIDEIRRSLNIPVVLVTHDFEDVLRLASHLLLLDRGRAVATGALEALTGRPDMPWLRAAVGLGSVWDATVSRAMSDRRLVELAFSGGTLLAADQALSVGMRVRVRIPAREVILATEVPRGLSLHNTLAGMVSAVECDPIADHAVVQMQVGDERLLAEITHDAVSRLGLAVGVPVYALIKSVSLELHAAGAEPRTVR
jgi:molybdate transport system ATP-binding protein